MYVKHVTTGAGYFWPQGYNLNKLGRSALGDAKPIINSQTLLVSDKKILSRFSYISLCKTFDPKGGDIFGPRGIS